MNRCLAGILALLAILPATGCMRTARARDTEYAGFLENYAHLQKGDRHDAIYQWRDPNADWTDYDKLMLDPVIVWNEADATSTLTERETAQLLTYFYNTLYIALSPDYLMVEAPQPGAVRVEVAVTGVGARRPILDTISGVSPLGIASTSVTWIAAGKAPFTGELAIEFRITDAATGKTLSEGADRRVGGRWVAKGLDRWADAYAAIDAYADNISYRLCVLRANSGCEPPLQP